MEKSKKMKKEMLLVMNMMMEKAGESDGEMENEGRKIKRIEMVEEKGEE